jgi:hypothetical protein
MAVHATAGTTRRLRWKDLAHADTGPVLVGATVTARIVRINQDGTSTNVVGPTVAAASGDDWYIDALVPDVPPAGARYLVVIRAVAGGGIEELEQELVVKAARP